MKRIGLLIGQESAFSEALIAEVNRRDRDVVAELVRLGATPMNGNCHYDVIVDRISHEVPAYQCYLKNAVLQGVHVINNPFRRIADDRYFGASLADALGLAVPRTIVLPNREHLPGMGEEFLRNLESPLDWDGILEYTGLPAVLKRHWGGSGRDIHIIEDEETLWNHYEDSGTMTLILQELIPWEQYVRVFVIGSERALPVQWDPDSSEYGRYLADQPPLSGALRNTVETHALRLCRALGYEINSIDFAVRDGVPYVVNCLNSTPDFDYERLGEHHFGWIVDKVADHAIHCALRPSNGHRPLHWAALFGETEERPDFLGAIG